MTRSRVCPDTESTCLSPASDALPETAIISDTGVPLPNTLICPPDTFKARPAAQVAHGITPAIVRDKFTPDEPASRIRTAVQDQDVIIYNASFDASFPGDLLAGARSVQCCMLARARNARDWSERTIADPDGTSESGLLTCHDCGHDAGGRTTSSRVALCRASWRQSAIFAWSRATFKRALARFFEPLAFLLNRRWSSARRAAYLAVWRGLPDLIRYR